MGWEICPKLWRDMASCCWTASAIVPPVATGSVRQFILQCGPALKFQPSKNMETYGNLWALDPWSQHVALICYPVPRMAPWSISNSSRKVRRYLWLFLCSSFRSAWSGIEAWKHDMHQTMCAKKCTGVLNLSLHQLANPNYSYIYLPLVPNIHLRILQYSPFPSTCHLSLAVVTRPSFQPHRSRTNDGHLWCCSCSCPPWEAPHGSTPRATSAPQPIPAIRIHPATNCLMGWS